MLEIKNNDVEFGEIGFNLLDTAAKAIVNNKQLVTCNGILYFVQKNYAKQIIELFSICKYERR